ncbi:MAG: hypothetical protein KDB80_10310 [Planctomycetes bacterium]|nr:hypothetical protein [Planctomycetota bacterium]
MMHIHSLALALALSAAAHAQVTMTATTFGNGVVVDGTTVAPAGTDVTAGYHFDSTVPLSFTSDADLVVMQTEQSLKATMWGLARSAAFTIAGQSDAQVEFHITSPAPMLVDVSLTILSESIGYCQGFPIGSGTASAQLLPWGPLTNEHCQAACTFTFDPMLLDAAGLTIQLAVDSAVGSAGICPLRSSTFACQFEVRPTACAQQYGTSCGADLSAVTGFSMPGQYDITVTDPGAQLGALMIGADQIAFPLLGCTLLTTPFTSLPLPLDPNGAITFQSGLPVLPFSLQAVTVENLVIHMSQGLLGCQ